MTLRSKNLDSAVVVPILRRVILRQTCAAEVQRRFKLAFTACCVEQSLFGLAMRSMHEAANLMDDQHCYVQGLYPVIAIALKLRYGILPSDVHVGTTIVDQNNVEQVLQWCGEGSVT